MLLLFYKTLGQYLCLEYFLQTIEGRKYNLSVNTHWIRKFWNQKHFITVFEQKTKHNL